MSFRELFTNFKNGGFKRCRHEIHERARQPHTCSYLQSMFLK